MNVNKFKRYENKNVTIGCEYLGNHNRLFYQTGFVLKVYSDYLLLKYNRNSLKRIKLNSIIDIKEG